MEPISLSRDNDLNVPAPAGEDGLYLHISNPCVVDLPEEGLITFRYRRGELHLVKGEHGTKAFTDLNLTEITDVEAEESEKEEASEGSQLDKLFEEASEGEEDAD